MPKPSEPTGRWVDAVDAVRSDLWDERVRQVRKWGFQDHGLDRWLVILVEEVGELAKAILETDSGIYDEAIQVAAVAAAIAQAIKTGEPV